MTDAILPDMSKHVFSTSKKVLESRPKGEAEKREEAINSLNNALGWHKGLKPYIEKRIESLKLMLDVDLDGKESVEEVGIRFIVSSSIAAELQDILSMVQTISMVKEEAKKKDAIRK
jgi:hypothetical protein